MQTSVLNIQGLRYHVLQWETDGKGRPVLLVHGLGSNARVWELVAELLQRAGLSPVSPDLRGHGSSEKPDGGYDFETIGFDLAELIQQLGLKQPLFVGHSWGAVLALDYAARYADHPAAPAGLVLVDGGMAQFDDYPGATWDLAREYLTPPRWAGMRVDDFVARLRDPSRPWQPDDRALEIILTSFSISDEGVIFPHMPFERYMRIVAKLWEFKTYERFQELRCPVLMLPVCPPESAATREQLYVQLKERGIEKARASIERVGVHWMEDAVHDVLLQKPEELAQHIIDFERSLRD